MKILLDTHVQEYDRSCRELPKIDLFFILMGTVWAQLWHETRYCLPVQAGQSTHRN